MIVGWSFKFESGHYYSIASDFEFDSMIDSRDRISNKSYLDDDIVKMINECCCFHQDFTSRNHTIFVTFHIYFALISIFEFTDQNMIIGQSFTLFVCLV